MKIKIEFEIDLNNMSDWCNTKFSFRDIEKIKSFLGDTEVRVSYGLRDFINTELKTKKEEGEDNENNT